MPDLVRHSHAVSGHEAAAAEAALVAEALGCKVEVMPGGNAFCRIVHGSGAWEVLGRHLPAWQALVYLARLHPQNQRLRAELALHVRAAPGASRRRCR